MAKETEGSDRIVQALHEIGHCPELKVRVADGVIVSIPPQRVFQVKRAGVRREVVIDEEIKR